MSDTIDNRRRMFTKRVIQEEFLKILKEKKLSKITVKEISAAAGINRGTFYYYYADPFQLYSEIENEFISQIMNYIKTDEEDISSWLGTLLHLLKDNQNMTIVVLADSTEGMLLDSVLNTVKNKTITSFIKKYPHSSSEERELFFTYFAQGSISVIKRWLLEFPYIPPDHIADVLINLLS